MKRKIEPNQIYTHFKGHEYRIVCLAWHTETEEQMVIYQDLEDHSLIFARPYDMFCSRVDKTLYPGEKQKYRFELKK